MCTRVDLTLAIWIDENLERWSSLRSQKKCSWSRLIPQRTINWRLYTENAAVSSRGSRFQLQWNMNNVHITINNSPSPFPQDSWSMLLIGSSLQAPVVPTQGSQCRAALIRPRCQCAEDRLRAGRVVLIAPSQYSRSRWLSSRKSDKRDRIRQATQKEIFRNFRQLLVSWCFSVFCQKLGRGKHQDKNYNYQLPYT